VRVAWCHWKMEEGEAGGGIGAVEVTNGGLCGGCTRETQDEVRI